MLAVQESWSQVNRELKEKEAEIARERDLNLQLQDEKYLALSKYEGARERNLSLDKECEQLLGELHGLSYKYGEVSVEVDKLTSQNGTLQRKLADLGNLLNQAQSDL